MTDWKRLFEDLGVPCFDSGKNVAAGCISIQCPVCSDSSNHGNFSIENGTYHCWRCKGTFPAKAVSLAAHIPLEKAKDLIRKYTTGDMSVLGVSQRKQARASEISMPGKALGEPHRKYLEGRNFDPDELVFYHGIKGTDFSGMWNGIDFRYRIMIPVYDGDGRLCTFQGRDYTGKSDLRYKCCPVEKAIVHHKHLLYGAEMAQGLKRIVVVEGVFDQWRMGQGCVATFGTSLTREQVNLLTNWKEVIFLFDPEPEAQQHARDYAQDIAACGCSVEICAAEFGNDKDGNPIDPGDLSPERARDIMRDFGFKR